MPEGLPDALHVRIPSDLVYVRPVRKMLEGLLVGQGWDEDDVDDAALIITEIVQNAVEHGSLADGTESIEISIRAEPCAVDIQVEDPGTGDDPRAALEQDVEQPVPMDEPRGRGLYLINRLASRMERDLTQAGGLCLRARKEVAS